MLADALEHLVRGIVDNPDDVTVTSRSLRRGDLLEVRVNPEDLGRVIGRSGRTARALRTVVGALADSPVRVDVVDTDRRCAQGLQVGAVGRLGLGRSDRSTPVPGPRPRGPGVVVLRGGRSCAADGDDGSRPGAVSSWPTSLRRCATSSPRPMGTQTTAR